MPAASVGDTATASLEVTTGRIEKYAAVVGDDNPLHVDGEYASASMFEGRIAHGMLTAGVVSTALANLPGDVVYLSQDLRFLDPVRPGETVTVTATVVEDLGDDRLRVATTAETDTLVLDGEAMVLSTPAADVRPEADAP